jgi:3-hydroxyacyl-CoA dehydrogenase / 3-hydroxy-2-methylbutyryl-CoA dehydrogenase
MDIENKTTFVVGGSSGLGKGVVERFLAHNAKVGVFDLNQGALTHENLIYCSGDVVDEESVSFALKETQQKFGESPRIVVYCAGTSAPGMRVTSSKVRLPLETFRRVIDVNLTGCFNVMSQAAEQMLKLDPLDDGERGVIINTASIGAEDGPMGTVPYSTSKAGMVGMTLPAARDLAVYGIRVNCISPGSFVTPLFDQIPDPMQQHLKAQTPFPKRFGDVTEFAELVSHLINNRMINGENIRIDGALRMAFI